MTHHDNKKIAGLRVDYALRSFDESDLLPNPIDQFKLWIHEAINAEANEPNAMTLATVKPDGTPSARIVLLKGIEENGFSFYTNYTSHKGIQLSNNPNVALVFCWLELQRQVRIEGVVERLPSEQSDVYFASRPRESQLGAHASQQSSTIINREVLEKNYAHFESLFEEKEVTRPDNWGGYLVKPHLIEFWQGRQSRLHDRFAYIYKNGIWNTQRLSP